MPKNSTDKTPKEMIDDLRACGFRWRQIARGTGISIGSMHDIWTGRTMTASKAVVVGLKDLHKTLQGRVSR
jgi:hypothetical protein